MPIQVVYYIDVLHGARGYSNQNGIKYTHKTWPMCKYCLCINILWIDITLWFMSLGISYKTPTLCMQRNPFVDQRETACQLWHLRATRSLYLENKLHSDSIPKQRSSDNSVQTLTKKSLATLDGEIVDPEITVKIEMRDVLKLHDAPNIYTTSIIITLLIKFGWKNIHGNVL